MMVAQPWVKHQLLPPKVTGAWVNHAEGEVLLSLKFNDDLHTDYGAPAEVWVRYYAGSASARSLGVDVSLLNKTATRLPEAMFMSFDPPHRSGLKWSMQKLSSWIDPSETLDGGACGYK